jgi:diacylglycerol kinase family enzyme
VQTTGHGPDFESSSRVKVWILYNERAGRGMTGADLRELIEGAGHTVVDVVSKNDAAKWPPGRSVDLMVAAGGDGTVAAAAGILVGTSVPLAILPLGTANNVAASLGLRGSISELAVSWHSARPVPFDLGWACAASHEWLVVEGAGGGLIPAGIAAAQQAREQKPEDENSADAALAAALRTFHDALLTLEPRRWTLVVDGKRFADDWLLVEILNIRSVGPHLMLSPDATPSDGFFDVITAGPKQRDELLTYLKGRIEGRQDARLSLPRWRARDVQIESCNEVHIDDDRVDICDVGTMSIRIAPGALTVLM